MKKKNLKTFLKTCGVVALAGVMLVGCGNSDTGSAGIETDGEETVIVADESEDSGYGSVDDNVYTTVSEIFKTENIWYYTDDGDGVAKDSEIEYVYVFDGEGNVTTYSLNIDGYNTIYSDLGGETLTFGDIEGLSDDEIIERVKEIEQTNFELIKDDVYDYVYDIYNTYTNTVGRDEEKAATTKEFLEYIDSAEWVEPVAEAYTLHVYTDDTGNIPESEEIVLPASSSYRFQTVSWYIILGINGASGNYTEYDPSELLNYTTFDANEGYSREMTITRELGNESTQTIYSDNYIVLGELSMKYTNYVSISLDAPTTEGIEVD